MVNKNILKIIFFNIVLLITIIQLKGQNITISGYVSDFENKEKLINALAIIDNKAISTNEFGFYSIKTKANDTVKINFRYLGYLDTTIILYTNINLQKNIYLKPQTLIDDIKIYGSKSNNLNYYNLSAEQIKILPSLTGEKDAIKAFQLLPGIQFGSEGTSNLYVRGGTPDQNLILIDDIPIHYINHLGSFVSIFDINAINEIKLIKNGIPAKYAGHLSSVMDIRLKDGNMKKLEGNITLGLLTTKISLNGPIVKDKLSFVCTARKSNLDLVSLLLYTSSPNDPNIPIYTFYDLNLKLNYKINENNKIDLLIYNGLDINRIIMSDSDKNPILQQQSELKYKYLSNNNWGNTLSSIRWTRNYKNNLFQKLVVGYTEYHYRKKQTLNEIYKKNDSIKRYSSVSYTSQIQDVILKLDYDYFFNSKHKINFGVSSSCHKYNPGSFEQETWKDSNIDTSYIHKNEKILSPIDFDLYISDSWTLNKITANFGIHTNIYYLKKILYNIQPRISLTFNPNSNWELLLSYDRTSQNIHALTISNSIVPADIWVPATEKAPQEKANQYTFGFIKKIANKKYSFSSSLFYKNSKNMIDYQRYFYINDTIKNYTWENQIVTKGTAKIYGAEILLEKNKGKLNGFISYTYMKNTRKFAELNNGKEFSFNYERKHSINIIANYQLNKKISFSTVFMYGSGYPTTLPIISQNYINIMEGQNALSLNANPTFFDDATFYSSEFSFENETFIYNTLNSYRMPAYHRLDIAINWEKQTKKGKMIWSLNIYNAYNQQNALFLFLSYDENRKLHLYKYTLFPIIPSISYSFKF